ncbi:phage major capsid protein [Tessaracoccus palaemonis]|uniref:Phage major capsid protein n=1 Tax=Tessaracoccus palaemonis TaxID=2829499 RepID=A0ABX8SIP6_9ACTN|nr:phage major capsid protein [Tessaracoccus palaemonis]QXT62749.1 phage major capsid protein [Tessaracoccus palaemonis]
MAGYDKQIQRANVPIPETVSKEIIQEAAHGSVVLNNARKVPLSTKTMKQPVLATLPEAYWLAGDTSLKETTSVEWENVVMTAEELAVLVPVPNALIDDTSIPIWSEIKPLLVEAIGSKVDAAAIWGDDKPTSWPTAIVEAATAAGNKVEAGADLTVGVAALGQALAEDGFAPNGFLTRPGFNWKLIGLRGDDGHPIYTPNLVPGQPSALYGIKLDEVLNGAWKTTDPATHLIGLDWKKFAVGIRQDITFDLFDQMVISDAAGKVVFNAAQQDSKVMRVVFRVGFQIANPLTRVNPTKANRYPAAVLTDAA